jgi:hypothetical protein
MEVLPVLHIMGIGHISLLVFVLIDAGKRSERACVKTWGPFY